MAVGAEGDPVGPGHPRQHVAEHRPVLRGHRVADGVGQVDRGGALLDRGLHHPAEEVGIGPAGVLGGELHVVGVPPRAPDGGAGPLDHLVAAQPQLLPHVQVGGGDEHVEPAPLGPGQRLAGEVDVPLGASRQRRDDRPPHLGGDLPHAAIVPLRRGREAGLDDVHAERVELPGESDLFLGGQAVAGGLLAVAERGVEDEDVAGAHRRFRFRVRVDDKSAADLRVRGAWCIRSRRCYCLTLLVPARRGPLAHQ